MTIGKWLIGRRVLPRFSLWTASILILFDVLSLLSSVFHTPHVYFLRSTSASLSPSPLSVSYTYTASIVSNLLPYTGRVKLSAFSVDDPLSNDTNTLHPLIRVTLPRLGHRSKATCTRTCNTCQPEAATLPAHRLVVRRVC